MWSAIALILILPALAMPFTHEVNWTAFDFAVAAVLLIGGGLIYELAVSRVVHGPRRMAATGLLGLLILASWAEGAVGVASS